MTSAERLLVQYANWLSIERRRAMRALDLDPHQDRVLLYGPAYEWHEANDEDPAARAAIVLAAVGVDMGTVS